MVAIIIALSSIGAFSTLYILRKLREWQWGWVNNKYCLRNRIFIITGANSGLGYETTKALVERNATVIMACRDIQKTNKAISEIRRKIYNGKLIAMNLDLSSFNSIRSFANEINNKYPEFYALIQNAGVATNKANQTTLDGHEVHVGTNYLGHFFLTLLLKETIHINQSRIVIVSSHLHESAKLTFIAPEEMNYKKNSVNPMYKTSKLMNFYFARHLYVQNFDVHILCPGLCYTSLFRDYELNWYQLIILLPIMCFILRSAKQGAQNIIYCATSHENNENENPMTGYFVKNLKPIKSKYKFNYHDQIWLWNHSLTLCSLNDCAKSNFMIEN